jgi:hypothetical protein
MPAWTKHSLSLEQVPRSRKIARILLRPSPATTVFWHVGCFRTSTTWLQEGVFPQFPRINYMGIRYLKSYRYQYDLVTSIAHRHGTRYEEDRVRREIGCLLIRHQPNVFSSEGLLMWNDAADVPARLERLFPLLHHHVIFTIRRQDSHVFSRYAHDLAGFNEIFARERGLPPGAFPAYPLQDAVTPEHRRCRWPDCRMTCEIPRQVHKSNDPCACLDARLRPIPLWFYDIHAMSRAFVEQFGRSRVHFLMLEETAHDPSRTINRLADILRISLTAAERDRLAAIEARNTMQSNSGDRMTALKVAYEAPGGLAEKIRAHFLPSNEKLQQSFPGLPLKDFGYC